MPPRPCSVIQRLVEMLHGLLKQSVPVQTLARYLHQRINNNLSQLRRWQVISYILDQMPGCLNCIKSLIISYFRSVYNLVAPSLLLDLLAKHTKALFILYATFFIFRSTYRNVRCIYTGTMERVLSSFGNSRYRRIRLLLKSMSTSKTFEEWKSYADVYDCLYHNDDWCEEPASKFYDYNRVERMMVDIRRLNDAHDIPGLMAYMRSRLLRNIAGTGHKELFTKRKSRTKRLIEEYVSEVVRALHLISIEACPSISNIQKMAFFNETRHSFGRSALMLSGGSTLGMYHVGVVKALAENQLLPKIISGASVGAIIASWVGTKTASELKNIMDPGRVDLEFFPPMAGEIMRKVHRLLTHGVVFDIAVLKKCLRANIGDITFAEAYARSGRVVNIVVAPQNGSNEVPRLLNYLTSPNVVMWSAACASAAIPYIFEPFELMSKDEHGNISSYYTKGVKWTDGSFSSDLPMKRLSELFNVNHYIVSQVNPHVIPFASLVETKVSSYFIMKLIKFLSGEVRYVYANLLEFFFHYIPFGESLKWIPVVVHQKYFGDITIMPKVRIMDYLRIATNPNDARLQQCARRTELLTWRKMAEIKASCDVEVALDQCIRRLRGAMLLSQELSFGKDGPNLLNSRLLSWAPEQFALLQNIAETTSRVNKVNAERMLASSQSFHQMNAAAIKAAGLNRGRRNVPAARTAEEAAKEDHQDPLVARRRSSTMTVEEVLERGLPFRIQRNVSNEMLAQVADSLLTPAGMETQELELPSNRDQSEETSDLYIS